MAIPHTKPITTTGSLPSLGRAEFTISGDVGDQRFIMSSLAGLYSDLPGAVTREYATNARDEHIKHKVKRPIEVTLPSPINRFYTVRDFAKGMSRADLMKIFTTFGVSTKRTSNDFNGMLGYGSKVAIAYTDKFTVTSVHEGVKTAAVIQKEQDGSIVLDIVVEQKTDEPSGLMVSVPVHNPEEFTAKAKNFFKFWLPGTVLVNGVEPKHDVGTKIADGLYHLARYEWNTSYIVMGGVAYRINNPAALFRDSSMAQVNFVAYVDNAEVEFTPSREDLVYSDITKNTLKRIVKDFESKILAQAKKEIDTAANHTEAYKRWVEWTSKLGHHMFSEMTFRGDKLVDRFPFRGKRWKMGSSRNSVQSINEWQLSWMDNAIIVTDFDISMSSNVKQKVRSWLALPENKDMDRPTYVLFTAASKVDNKWIDKSVFYKWEDIKAAVPKKPRNTGGGYSWNAGRIKGSWDLWTKDGFKEEQEIPKGKTVYYIDHGFSKDRAIAYIINYLNEDCVVIRMPANRWAKFHRENPKVESFWNHACSKVIVDAESLLSDDAKKIHTLNHETQRLATMLDLTRVDDPAFKEFCDLASKRDVLLSDYSRNQRLANVLGMGYNVKTYSGAPINLLAKYPLLSGRALANMDHVYIYINAVYAAEKDKK